MEELINLIAADEQPYQISDKIKEILYMKTADMIDEIKPQVAANIFQSEE